MLCTESLTSPQQVRKLLLRNPVENVYQLGDLEEPFWSHCEWKTVKQREDQALYLFFKGLSEPTFLSSGAAHLLEPFLSQEREWFPDAFYFKVSQAEALVLEKFCDVQDREEMYSMVWEKTTIENKRPNPPERRLLASKDLQSMLEVYQDYSGHFFEPVHLEWSPFFGVFVEDELVSIAGLHVWNPKEKVAALGNIVTRKSQRSKGYAQHALLGLLKHLVSYGIETIVLHVNQKNNSAIRCYQQVGFSIQSKLVDGRARWKKKI